MIPHDEKRMIAELTAAGLAMADGLKLEGTTFDSMFAGVWIICAKGVTRYVNQRTADMLGYTREEMVGRSYHDFMDEEFRAIAVEKLRRRLAGISENQTFKLTHKDGSDVWFSMANNPIFDAEGRSVGALALILPIAEPSAMKPRASLGSSIQLNVDTREVMVNGQLRTLSPKEFHLFKFFFDNENRVLSRKEILTTLWNNEDVADQLINAHVVSVRKIFAEAQYEIKAIYGQGYVLRKVRVDS